MTSLRSAYIDSVDVSIEDELSILLEMPLTDDERHNIRARSRAAAERLEQEAADIWGRMGKQLSADARVALARSIDQAAELRRMADAMEAKK